MALKCASLDDTQSYNVRDTVDYTSLTADVKLKLTV